MPFKEVNLDDCRLAVDLEKKGWDQELQDKGVIFACECGEFGVDRLSGCGCSYRKSRRIAYPSVEELICEITKFHRYIFDSVLSLSYDHSAKRVKSFCDRGSSEYCDNEWQSLASLYLKYVTVHKNKEAENTREDQATGEVNELEVPEEHF